MKSTLTVDRGCHTFSGPESYIPKQRLQVFGSVANSQRTFKFLHQSQAPLFDKFISQQEDKPIPNPLTPLVPVLALVVRSDHHVHPTWACYSFREALLASCPVDPSTGGKPRLPDSPIHHDIDSHTHKHCRMTHNLDPSCIPRCGRNFVLGIVRSLNPDHPLGSQSRPPYLHAITCSRLEYVEG